jgi:hypothetical protein
MTNTSLHQALTQPPNLALIANPNSHNVGLNFIADSMPAGTSFSRASSGTEISALGTLIVEPLNAPRFDFHPTTLQPRGLLIEGARTNLLLNSATLGTQSITVSATTHTLSFYGTGSVTLSGAATGTLNGTGAFPNRANLTFTPSAGTLTLTVTGSVLHAQCEVGAFASSWIPTTGAAATRAADNANITDLPTIGFNPLEGTVLVEFESTVTFASGMPDRFLFSLGTDTINNARVVIDTTGTIRMASATAGVTDVNVSDGGGVRPPGFYRVAFAYKENDFAICTNGGTVVTDSVCVVPPINQLRIGQNIIGAVPLFDRMRRLNYTPTRLPNAQLQSLTAS